MSGAGTFASGKGHRDENFPVASLLIHPRYREPVLAFYRFARAADDVADHATAEPKDKLRLLEEMDRTLTGELDSAPEALALRQTLLRRNLSPQQGVLLLEAFRRDVTKLRYAHWDELIDYCRYSAMPVGRFVLDVHGESRTTWPASDALCAALQIINHLQDCAKDYRALNRVYIPLDSLGAAGLDVDVLAEKKAPPQLLSVIAALALRTSTLLVQAKPLSSQVRDRRLGLEISFIQRLAESLNRRLMHRDPLSQRVHHRKVEAMALLVPSLAHFIGGRLGSKKAPAMVEGLQDNHDQL